MSARGATGLGLEDILDLRAYERVRDQYRRRIIELKRRRRVPIGPLVTAVFECADTVRFQVHEMARAERIVSDEALTDELDVYNRLVPVPGELSATVFIELTSETDLRHWLPRLVGIERALVFEIGDPPGPVATIECTPEESHAEALTREAVTAAVHYVRFVFDDEARARLSAGERAVLAVRHPEYEARTEITPQVRAELVSDLEGTRAMVPLG